MIPAKILLFGEHIVIKGAQALVIPFDHFSGKWRQATSSEHLGELQMNLADFSNYLEEFKGGISFASQQFLQDLEDAWYFDSNIPRGYGLGSSGAITAAVFKKYCLDYHSVIAEKSLGDLKHIFAKMESFFHGTSSGIDPLICHLAEPIWLKSKDNISTVENDPLKGATLFLVDTGVSRSTSPFVNTFLKKWENEDYARKLTSNLFPLNNLAIKEFINGKGEELYNTMSKISRIQFSHFKEMILTQHLDLWETGLNNDLFKLKICGAGGGGFMLGITRDFDQVKSELENYELIRLKV